MKKENFLLQTTFKGIPIEMKQLVTEAFLGGS